MVSGVGLRGRRAPRPRAYLSSARAISRLPAPRFAVWYDPPVSSSIYQILCKNNAFPRAKLARYCGAQHKDHGQASAPGLLGRPALALGLPREEYIKIFAVRIHF